LSDDVWVAEEAPRHYRKMTGSKSGIRMCTFCWEEDRKIIFGEYEVSLSNQGGKVFACQSHRDREEAREPAA